MPSFLSRLIRRPVTASMLVTSLSLLGVVGMFRLPLGLLPNLASPGVTVLTRYPGVSSDAIERILTIPIERELRDVASIEQMLSSSSDGESRVHLIFRPETDVDLRMLDVREKLFQLEERFPREVEPPSVLRYDPSDRPIFIVSFSPPEGSGKDTLRRVRDIAELQIKPGFERIRGVSEVFVGGGAEREIQVQIDPHRLVALKLSGQGPASILDDNNQFIPTGHLEKRRSLIYTDARLRSLYDIESLLIPRRKTGDQREERKEQAFSSFASISDTERNPTSLSLNNGKERITLYIQKAGDANTLSITDICEKELAGIVKKFPDIETHVVYNQGNQIKEAISQVVSGCIAGIVLAVAILHLFLKRIGFTLVIGIAIPASLLSTFFLMFLLHIELNVMSLSGLALGAGMLIDASIVVSEASATALSRNANPAEAIEGALRSVRSEVIASTFSTIIVFIPLLFTDHETRSLYRDFTLTVSLSLITSMIFSLTVLPAFLIPASRLETRPFFSIRGRAKHLFDSFIQFLNKDERLQSTYWIRSYSELAARKRPVLLAITAMVIAAPILFILLDKEYMARTETDTIEASIDLDPGIHLQKTREIVQAIEEQITKQRDIREINSKIENSRGTLTIKIDPEANASSVIEELHSITDGNAEAYVHYERSGEQSGTQELELEFFGEDIAAMKEFAGKFSHRLKQEIPGVERVILRFRDGRQDLILYPYRTKNDLAAVSTSTIGSGLRQLLQGNVITKYYDSSPGAEREVDVRIKATEGMIQTPEDVFALQIPGTAGPLKTLTRSAFENNETRIFRKNRRRSVSILIQFSSTMNGGAKALADSVETLLAKSTLPRDTVAGFGDSYEKMLKNQKHMIISLLLSILLVYLLLAFLFENLLDPLFVLLTIPISLSAVFLTLFALNRSLNISIYIGLIMLGGIVVNNAILILSEIRSSAEALFRIEHFVGAAFHRLRPILMTTATTVLGMFPLLFNTGSQSALWNSLAITVTTGLVFSMPIVLFIIPFITYLQKHNWKKSRGTN